MAIKPSPLKQNDKVAIVSPARKVDVKDINAAIEILQGWGLKVETGKYLFSSHDQFAGTDAQRTADLQNALDDNEIRAIFCARGGYGTTRILDNLNFDSFQLAPKWVCGFSDITALLAKIYNNNIESIHGTMPALFKRPDAALSVESLRKLLFDEPYLIFSDLHELNRHGEANGELIGGNLSMLCNQIGTSSDIDTKNKIFFIEDLDEYLYHIDRMVLHLKRSGKLADLAALIVGQMSDMKDNAIPFGKTAYEIIVEHTQEYDYPVCFNFPVGHTGINMAVPMGRKGNLKITESVVQLDFEKIS